LSASVSSRRLPVRPGGALSIQIGLTDGELANSRTPWEMLNSTEILPFVGYLPDPPGVGELANSRTPWELGNWMSPGPPPRESRFLCVIGCLWQRACSHGYTVSSCLAIRLIVQSLSALLLLTGSRSSFSSGLELYAHALVSCAVALMASAMAHCSDPLG
jgi:hypothetical protein